MSGLHTLAGDIRRKPQNINEVFARAAPIATGELDFRRRWWLFGPKELFLTAKGRAALALAGDV